MSKLTYLDESYVRVRMDENIPAVCVTHHGYQTSEEFRLTVSTAITCVQENTPRFPNMGWLADTRKLNALEPEDLAWCNKAIVNSCPQLGKLALVIPVDAFGAMAVKDFADSASAATDVLQTRVFPSIEEAITWLKNE